jgi:mono/diheme cytochrome c family protein
MKKIFLIVIIAMLVGYAGYEAMMYYDNEFIYGRMRETPAVRPYEEPILIMETALVPFSGGEAIYSAMDGKKLKSPYPKAETAILSQGEKGYFTYCAQCHGKYHDGKGTVGQSFAPLPGDLRSQKVQALPDGLFFQEISYGIPNGRQPALATTISLGDRWKIIAYIKSLGVRK